MKQSIYNYLTNNGVNGIIYNCRTDEVLELVPELLDLYKNHQENPDEIKNIHPDLYKYLCDKEFIVENDMDELNHMHLYWQREDAMTDTYNIIVNPTMDCNMKCWYCYEKHPKNTKISTSKISAVKNLIKSISQEKQYRLIDLSFFGGEPLLFFEETVKPIIMYAEDICKKNDMQLKLRFTTNAFTLTEEKLIFLKNYETSFQITLDGNERGHDLVRKTYNGEKTYKTIVKHIKDAIGIGFDIAVRFNYTAKSLPQFIDTVSDFKTFTEDERKKLNFTFHRVWQDNDGNPDEIERKILEIETIFRNEGFYVNPSLSNVYGRCYADKTNSIVVNYDGQLYKCTARDFTVENSEGVINDDGTISWNEKYYKRMAIRDGNSMCLSCRIYPLCHGGCSQFKLESKIETGCIKNLSEENKNELLEKRIRDIFAVQRLFN